MQAPELGCLAVQGTVGGEQLPDLAPIDHLGRAPEAISEITGLIAEGRLTPLETVVEGFEQLPTAINMLFDGKNVGKLVVKVGNG